MIISQDGPCPSKKMRAVAGDAPEHGLADRLDAALEAQSANVAPILNVSFILIPSIALLLGTLALKVFPINKKTFESIKAALEARRNGEDYSQYMDDVQKVVGRK